MIFLPVFLPFPRLQQAEIDYFRLFFINSSLYLRFFTVLIIVLMSIKSLLIAAILRQETGCL